MLSRLVILSCLHWSDRSCLGCLCSGPVFPLVCCSFRCALECWVAFRRHRFSLRKRAWMLRKPIGYSTTSFYSPSHFYHRPRLFVQKYLVEAFQISMGQRTRNRRSAVKFFLHPSLRYRVPSAACPSGSWLYRLELPIALSFGPTRSIWEKSFRHTSYQLPPHILPVHYPSFHVFVTRTRYFD